APQGHLRQLLDQSLRPSAMLSSVYASVPLDVVGVDVVVLLVRSVEVHVLPHDLIDDCVLVLLGHRLPPRALDLSVLGAPERDVVRAVPANLHGSHQSSSFSSSGMSSSMMRPASGCSGMYQNPYRLL